MAMAKNYILKAESSEIKISPFGFHKYASDYLETAEKWPTQSTYSPVPYFLYCRTIELGIKAYLLAKGKDLDFIKFNIRHDLTKGLNNAILNALDDILETTDIEKAEIEVANKYYKDKGFEYFFVEKHATGLMELPELEVLKRYAHKLLSKIKALTYDPDIDLGQ
jgi:hypothetical protein